MELLSASSQPHWGDQAERPKGARPSPRLVSPEAHGRVGKCKLCSQREPAARGSRRMDREDERVLEEGTEL